MGFIDIHNYNPPFGARCLYKAGTSQGNNGMLAILADEYNDIAPAHSAFLFSKNRSALTNQNW